MFSATPACILYLRILAAAGAANLLLVTFLIPITAILLSSTFLRDQLVVWHIAEMGILGPGLAVIDGRLLRFLRCGSVKT